MFRHHINYWNEPGMEIKMAVAVLNSVELFDNSAMISTNKNIEKMLAKLADQEKKLRLLKQNFLKERYAKESLQSDLEHVLCQLKSLQQVHKLAKQIDVTYL